MQAFSLALPQRTIRTMDLRQRPGSGWQLSRRPRARTAGVAALLCTAGAFLVTPGAQSQAVQNPAHRAAVTGTVRDAAGRPVIGATVSAILASAATARAVTGNDGAFTLPDLAPGQYTLSAVKDGATSLNVTGIVLAPGALRQVDLHIVPPDQMSFSDSPDFTVAGVTDWTAIGGHGSDSILRTSEDLARETAALESRGASKPAVVDAKEEGRLRAALAGAPGSFPANHALGSFYLQHGRAAEALPLLTAAYNLDPNNAGNERDLAEAYMATRNWKQAQEHVQHLLAVHNTGDLHRMAGDLDEKLGDPLACVQQYREAVALDPSEQNYLAWGAELLLHRAVWQATEVLRDGVRAHPESQPLLTALGSALFAGANYDEAATRLCQAADLVPGDPQPYLFMAKVDRAAPSPLACIEPRLARFLRQHPDDPQANYAYAMAVCKRNQINPAPATVARVEGLLHRATALDPRCSEAYLQLGILAAARHHDEEAVSLYDKALSVDPQLSEAHYRLAVAYDRLGQRQQAAREFALHDQIQQQQAAAVEQQRRQVKQFVVANGSAPAAASQ